MASIRARGQNKQYPFRDGADWYRRCGYPGTLPVSRKSKRPLVSGFHGWHAPDPDYAMVHRWTRQFGNANLALRLPAGVVGIDVDAYHGGDETLQLRSAELGSLPDTWKSTSRAPEDSVSGIYLFSLTSDLALAGNAGTGIDIIQRHHRYVIVDPSIHPETGRRYKWWQAGEPTDGMHDAPLARDLPELPNAWLEYLLNDNAADGKSPGASLAAAREWYRNRAYGEPCEFMAAEGQKALREMVTASHYGGLHDALNFVTLRLMRYAAEGHPGLHEVLKPLQDAFCGAKRERGRGLLAEWRRAVGGAAAMVAPEDTGDDDFCELIKETRNAHR